MTKVFHHISLNRQIYKIAYPSILGMVGLIIFETIDIFWIGKLSGRAVAGVAASAFILWTAYSLMCITTTGCSTLVAQFFGAKKREGLHDVIREALWLSLLNSILIMLLLFAFTSTIFAFMGLDATTHSLAMKYITVLIVGFPIIYIFSLQGHIFNAYGDTKTSTAILVVTLIINIVLDPILIFGWLGFPKLGIAGASIATVISEFIGVILRTYYLRKKGYIGEFSFLTKVKAIYYKRIIKIGLPSAATNVTWTMVFPLLTVIITKFGMDPLAGLNIAHRIEGIPYFTSLGFSIAISTLVGQSLGRGDKQEVNRIFLRGIVLITLILFPVALAFILIPQHLIGLLNSDPNIIKHGSEYLRIIGFFEVFLGWELVIEAAFNGLGNTKPYMNIRIPLTLARVPLAYFFAIYLNFGITGVWWAIGISTALKGLTLFVAFKTNKTNKRLLAEDNLSFCCN